MIDEGIAIAFELSVFYFVTIGEVITLINEPPSLYCDIINEAYDVVIGGLCVFFGYLYVLYFLFCHHVCLTIIVELATSSDFTLNYQHGDC